MWLWWVLGCASGPNPSMDVEEAEGGCNGHPALCSRPLDQVTLAGTHNSMSNADAEWLAPNQQHGIGRQLEDGIRALMLDTMEWNGEPYLCHGYCELGAQPLSDGLQEVEDFLETNPNEVVLIIFQDGLSVETTVAVMDEVGLTQRVWSASEEPFPTLQEMIDAGTRIVVTAESSGPPPSWYHHAWSLIEDTPYGFSSAEEFECTPNRGSADSPLFLMNHWLSTPLPTEEGAQAVNRADILESRAVQCEREREKRINILAVDFYNHGDLFDVVDRLNGVE